MATLTDLEQKYKLAGPMVIDRSNRLPPEEPKRYSIDDLESKYGLSENDPSTPIGPNEIAPKYEGVKIHPLEMANTAGGVGAGMAIGSAILPGAGTVVGGIIGGGLAAASNKGYSQSRIDVGGRPIPLSKQYLEEAKAIPGGMATGAAIAAPEAVAPVRGAIGALEQTAKYGIGSGVKEAGKYALERGVSSAAASYPLNVLQQTIENPDQSISSSLGKAGGQSLVYGGLETATAGLGAAGKIYKGAGINASIAKYVKGANDIANTIQKAGGPALTTAQAMQDGELRNKAFNFVKNLWGGANLRNLEQGQIQKLSDYAYKLVDDLKSGVPAEKTVRELYLKTSSDAVSNTIKSVNIKGIKDASGVPSIKKMEDLTTKVGQTIDSIRIDAGTVLGKEIPTDAAQRSQLFEDEYKKVFKYIDDTGERLNIAPVRNAVGITPEQVKLEQRYQDVLKNVPPEQQANVRAQLGISQQESFEDVMKRGLINDFTTKDAKRLVTMLPDNPTFDVAHANRSALGRAEQRATDPVVKRIFTQARLAMTKAMDETAMKAGPEQYKMFKAVDSAYGQSQLYEDLTGKMSKTPMTEIQPVIDKPILRGKALAEYLRANKDDLLNNNKLSPQKFSDLYKTSLEQMNIQDKSSALRNAPGHTKELYNLYDNITGNQALELKEKLINSLDGLEGKEAANVRNTIKQLDAQTAASVKSAGVYDQWKTVNDQISKDRLGSKLSNMLESNSVLDKNNTVTIRGGTLSKYLDKNKDNLINAYDMKPDHFRALKSVAVALNKIEGSAPSGTAVLIGGQVSTVARSPQIAAKGLLGETASAVGQTANVATIGAAPWLVSKILDNPYILESNDATKVLARELAKITEGRIADKMPFTGNSSLLGGKIGKYGVPYEMQASAMSKVYAAWSNDKNVDHSKDQSPKHNQNEPDNVLPKNIAPWKGRYGN